MDELATKVARTVAIGRVAYGAACMSVPRLALGPDAKDAPDSLIWMGRAFGVRDVILGAGALLALADDQRAATRWVEMGAAADGLDLANAVVFRRELGGVGLAGVTALAVPATLAGLWAARRLRAGA
jgi:hypothetical protein